jgi:hypothetical protein
MASLGLSGLIAIVRPPLNRSMKSVVIAPTTLMGIGFGSGLLRLNRWWLAGERNSWPGLVRSLGLLLNEEPERQ